MINGKAHFVLVTHPFAYYDLKRSTGTGEFLDINKAAAAAQGGQNILFTGGEFVYNNVIVHQHRTVPRFTDYGSGNNVAACESLFLGVQAIVVAYGSKNGAGQNRMDWIEETDDRGNQIVIDSAMMMGLNKTTFNSFDFGVFSVFTAAADPG
jgi:N4-gp56 family major capsid protein